MPIKFQCAACAAPIKAPDTHAGHNLPCPKCGQPVQVPLAATPPAAATSAPPVMPAVMPAVMDVEDQGELPQIIVQDAPPIAAEVPEFDDSAISAPPMMSQRTTSDGLQSVRVVDLDLPFKSVFKFAFQFFISNLVFGAVIGLVGFLIILLLGTALGVSLGVK